MRVNSRSLVTSVVACVALMGPIAQAAQYQVTIDTSALTGTLAEIAFDFLDGGLPTNGITFSGFATDGGLGATISTGDVTGSLPGSVTLGDGSFFNEHLTEITLGTTLTFIFTPTDNPPALGSVPDAFSLFLLEPTTLVPLFSTSDPTGSDALLLFNIDGSAVGVLNAYLAPGQEVSVQVSQVPIPACLPLFAAGLFGVAGVAGGRAWARGRA